MGSDTGLGTFVDKETGLIVCTFGTMGTSKETIEVINCNKYEFNTVTDEDFKEPDITEYTMQEYTE